MEKRLLRSLNVLFILTLLSLLLVGGIFLYGIVFGSPAPSSAAQQTPTNTIEVRVKSLEKDLDYLQRDLVFRLDQKLFYFGGIALVISAVAAFFGWKTYKDLDEKIQKKIETTLDQQLYQLDPTNLKIWLVSYDKAIRLTGDKKGEYVDGNVKEEMQKVQKRIELTGLKNIRGLDAPDHRCYQGVTILPVFDLEMEQEFREYLERNISHLDPQKAAFILYTRDYRVSQKETLDKYDNLAAANMPPTTASMILTVGRGLVNPKPTQKEEEA